MINRILFCSITGLLLINPLHATTTPKTKTEFCQCNPCECDSCTCGTKCGCCRSNVVCESCSCTCTQRSECLCNMGDKACCAKNLKRIEKLVKSRKE